MKKRTRTFLMIAIGFIVFGMASTVSAYFFVRTPTGSRFLISVAQRYLSRYSQTELQYESGSIDPFSHLRFKNLKLVQKQGAHANEIRIPSLEILFSFSMFSRQVDIDRIRIEEPSIVFYAPSTPGDKSTPDGGKEIQKYFTSPPLKLSIKQFEMSRLHAEIHSDPNTHITLHDLNLHFAMKCYPNDFSFSGDAGIAGRSTVSIATEGTSLEFSPYGSGKWNFSIRNVNQQWTYETKDSEFRLGSREVSMRQPKQHLVMKDIALEGSLRTLIKSPQLFALDSSSIHAIALHHEVRVGSTHLERPENPIELGSQVLTLSSNSENSDSLKTSVTYLLDKTPRLEFAMAGPLQGPMEGKGRFSVPNLVKAIGALHGDIAVTATPQSEKWIQLGIHVAQVQKGTVEFEPITLQGDLGKRGDKLALNTSVSGTKAKSQGKILRDFSFALKASRLKEKIDFEGLFTILNEKTVQFSGGLLAQKDRVALQCEAEAFVGDHLEGFVTRKQLAEFGRWTTHTQLSLKGSGNSLHAQGTTTLTQTQPGSRFATQPITIRHEASRTDKLSASIESEIPSFRIPSVAEIQSSKLTGKLSTTDNSGKNLDVSIDASQGNITLDRAISGVARPIHGAALSFIANVRNGERFTLEQLSASLDRNTLTLSAEATGNLRKNDFQTVGKLQLEVPKDFPVIAEQRAQGRVEFPWKFSITRGREILFDGELHVLNLNWSKGEKENFRLSQISGRIPISEKLVLKGDRIQFASIITQNPFERVDYERLRPLIHKAEQLRIEQVGFEEKHYGPFVGYFSMKQNVVFGHQFDMTLGTTGVVDGEMYLDVYPAHLQMGFLSRLTAVNLAEILPGRYLANVKKDDKFVSGRSGLVVNLKQGTIDGRMDITEIGGSQLVTLINVLDPKYENDKMNMTRSALGVGYPTFVEMSFQKGYLDLGMNLRLLGINQRFDVWGIPLSTLVSSATSDIVKMTQEGPLQ